jgi:hypothetical protein
MKLFTPFEQYEVRYTSALRFYIALLELLDLALMFHSS